MNVNVLNLIIPLATILATILLAFIFRKFFKRYLKKSTAEIKSDPTNYRFLSHLITALIYIVGFSMAAYKIEAFRAIAGSLLAGAGILAIAVGFASQQALSNIISGILIVVFKPIRITDRVSIKDTLRGVVEDITLRHTVIRDFHNRRIVIPNSILSNEVIINSDLLDKRMCRFIEIGISFDSDIDNARKIMKEEILNHPFNIDPRSEEQIAEGVELAPVRVLQLTDSSVLLRGWAWAKDLPNAFLMECDLLESIKKRFDIEGVEIPFPYRTVVFKKDIDKSFGS